MSAIGFRAADAGPGVWTPTLLLRRGWAGWLVDVGTFVFCLAMLWLMYVQGSHMSIPYHSIFLVLTLVYGFRVWPLLPTLVVLSALTAATGFVLYDHYRHGLIDGQELGEIPLMPALVLAMVWHARRREAAQDALLEVAGQQREILARERSFFRNTSHAIRTPVTIARGHLELATREIAAPQAREDVDVALRQLERMSLLSDRLIALAQLDAGEKLPAEPMHLVSFIHEVGNNWAAEPGRRWVVNCPDDAVFLADPAWLGLAVDALIENAVHFTCEGGRIELIGKVSTTCSTIRVSDDGPGIDPQDLDHIFERFWHRLPPSGPMGTGLGLAIALATARACGGDLRALTNDLGGATFELTLPRVSGGPRARGVWVT